MTTVFVIGAGLAGCEAAWQLAKAGISVNLYEMKPKRFSPAHHNEGLAELVCSNSLKAIRPGSASGMLKREMEAFGSLIMQVAWACQVPAGGALAVNRDQFSQKVTAAILGEPNIHLIRDEVSEIPAGLGILATGPLTSDTFANVIAQKVGGQCLSFFDAAAPIVTFESVNMEKAFFAARYGRGDADYINCPMHEQEYEAFYQELIAGETAPLHDFDQKKPDVYEGCMPIEVLAKRGKDSIRYGPLRPVGLRHPKTDEKYYAVLQLRKENTAGTLYNLVGFQTNLKFGEQKRIFGMIPGLEQAEFVRYGVMHRNTFLDSPKLLDSQLRLRTDPRLRFAGQMTGVEGYLESAACGIYAGLQLARECGDKAPIALPRSTMLGSLVNYITDSAIENFQPMGSNMGLLPPLKAHIRNKQERYVALSDQGYRDLLAELGDE